MIIWPDPILSRISEPTTFRDSVLIAKRLRAVMLRHGGCGLAAPQIGILKRVIVIAADRLNVRAFVNPRIIDHWRTVDVAVEGCLSLPGRRAIVRRFTDIAVEHETADGTVITDLRGMEARIAQHEIEHLDGLGIWRFE